MSTKVSHIIEFVADMNRAVAFYRGVVGLTSEHKFWWQAQGSGEQREAHEIYPKHAHRHVAGNHVKKGCAGGKT